MPVAQQMTDAMCSDNLKKGKSGTMDGLLQLMTLLQCSKLVVVVHEINPYSKDSVQIQGFLLTLLHHKLNSQENVPKVLLISVKGARHFTRSQVLKTQFLLML